MPQPTWANLQRPHACAAAGAHACGRGTLARAPSRRSPRDLVGADGAAGRILAAHDDIALELIRRLLGLTCVCQVRLRDTERCMSSKCGVFKAPCCCRRRCVCLGTLHSKLAFAAACCTIYRGERPSQLPCHSACCRRESPACRANCKLQSHNCMQTTELQHSYTPMRMSTSSMSVRMSSTSFSPAARTCEGHAHVFMRCLCAGAHAGAHAGAMRGHAPVAQAPAATSNTCATCELSAADPGGCALMGVVPALLAAVLE